MINCDRDCLNCIYAECMVDERVEEVNRKKKINGKRRSKYTRIILNKPHDFDEYYVRTTNRYYYDY